ncbi:hypothetical protein MMC14_009345 [Varicellaria rhodocarpa]|nr:hypothetical protein [Varicellaria rhodocarpa]
MAPLIFHGTTMALMSLMAHLCSVLDKTDIVQTYIQTTTHNYIFDTFWIQGLTLVVFHEPYSYPLPAAPYLRLAGMSPVNSTKTYVYHRLGPTIIGEEIFDYSLGLWMSSIFTVITA